MNRNSGQTVTTHTPMRLAQIFGSPFAACTLAIRSKNSSGPRFWHCSISKASTTWNVAPASSAVRGSTHSDKNGPTAGSEGPGRAFQKTKNVGIGVSRERGEREMCHRTGGGTVDVALVRYEVPGVASLAGRPSQLQPRFGGSAGNPRPRLAVPGWVLGGPRHVRVGHAALVFVVRLHCPGRKPRKRVVKRLWCAPDPDLPNPDLPY